MAGEKENQNDISEETEMEPLKEVGLTDDNANGSDTIDVLQELNDSDNQAAEDDGSDLADPDTEMAADEADEDAFDESEQSSVLGQSDIDKALAAMQKEVADTEASNSSDGPVPTNAESIADSVLEAPEAEPSEEEETANNDSATEDESDLNDAADEDETAEPGDKEAAAALETDAEAATDDPSSDDDAETSNNEDNDDNQFDGLDDEDAETGAAENEPDHGIEDEAAARDSIDESEGVEDPKKPEKIQAPLPEKTDDSKTQKPVNKKKKEKPAERKSSATKQKTTVLKHKKKEMKSNRKAAGSLRVLKIAALIAGLAGVALYSHPSILKMGKEAEQSNVKPIEAPVVLPIEQPQEEKPARPVDDHRATLAEAKRLRQELLVKKEEIKQLNKHYRLGIANLEYDILEDMKRLGITGFSEAQKNKKIELNLRTIQRRQAYTQLLEKPIGWITAGSEELLYLSRKAIFDLQILPIASGVDMDRHIRHLNAVIQKYQLSADKLTIDLRNADLQTIDAIWQRINSQKEKVYAAREYAHNQGIWDEICNGDLGRIGEMTSLSAEAAACLSQLKGADLFLNGIADLSINAAEKLVHWQANWICLNGFKTLPPDIATYLFQWEGNWLSLNGLSEFPPESAKLLANWKGRQLELMGLNYKEKKSERIGLEYLAQWEKSGGKLYVPEKIRKEIEKMM